MPVTRSVLKEFIRKVYRVTAEDDLDRGDYLDGLSDIALASLEKGKGITASSGNGTTVNYEFFFGWNPDTLLELIDEARDLVTEATVALAIADQNPIRQVSTNFTKIDK